MISVLQFLLQRYSLIPVPQGCVCVSQYVFIPMRCYYTHCSALYVVCVCVLSVSFLFSFIYICIYFGDFYISAFINLLPFQQLHVFICMNRLFCLNNNSINILIYMSITESISTSGIAKSKSMSISDFDNSYQNSLERFQGNIVSHQQSMNAWLTTWLLTLQLI